MKDHALADLPDRKNFLDNLSKLLSANDIKPFAVIAIAIDRFPQINHILGHNVGERLLQNVGLQLKDHLSYAQFFAKMSNNVFIGVLPEVNENNYTVYAEQILTIFDKAFSVYTVSIDLDPLIGFSFYPQNGSDASELLQNADVALYARFTPERYAIYTFDKDPQHKNKLSLMSELREGLIQNEFEVYYQPKVNLQSNKIEQVEALARWHHPIKGFLMPEHFMALAEETGHIKKLTIWLIEQAFSQISSWHQQKLPIGMSLNLSVKDLLNKNLFDKVKEILEKYQASPDWITFEITESTFMQDPERAIAALLKLHKLGVHFSVDDFGTGYSSLTYLKKLPIKELKIDQSFIQEMLKDERVREIVHSTIDLGHRLNMAVVAEGVEDQNTYNLLKKMGCDMGQGYYFSKPISGNDFFEFFSNT